MNFIKRLGILLLFIAIRAVSMGQTYPMKFNHISYKEGLSQSPIGAIFQDKKGFIWIGNREGLIRYDGYEFVTYSHKEGDRNSLSHNLIRVIAQDSTGKLWIGTSNGLNVFDPATEKFTYLDISQGKTVPALLIDNQNCIWVASYDGLKRIKVKSSNKLEVLHLDNEDLKNGMTRALLQDRDGKIWIGLANGIKCLNPSSLTIIPLPDIIRKRTELSEAPISAIREDRSGDIWISTEGKGFFWYKTKENICRNFQYFNNQLPGLPSNVIKDILIYDAENIWLGTRMGLSIFNKRTLTFTNYQHNSSDEKSLSQNSIWNFLRDQSGNIWMGTYAGGLNVYYPKFNDFENIGEKIGNNLGLSQPIVNDILEEKNGLLWIATDGGGLNYIDREKGISRYFPLKDREGRHVSHIVKVMARGNKGQLYLGTLEGLGQFDQADGTINYLHIGKTASIDSRRINALLVENGKVWVGTHKLGLWTIDSEGQIESLNINLSNISIQALYAAEENIWIGTTAGLYLYNKKSKNVTKYKEFNKYIVSSLFIDSKDRFWIGTDKGIALFNPRNNKKQFITEKSGLVNNIIEAIVEDDLGNIWISTQKGLSKINYKGLSGNFSSEKPGIYNYTSDDGLSSNQFMQGAALKSKTGELLFGGVNGLTTFYPEKIVQNRYLPPVVITDLLIHNKSVKKDFENSPSKSPVDSTKPLILKYNQNSLTFKAAALNYINSSNNQYAYKLEGFDKEDEWYYAGTQRTISYTNLPEGNYTFKIKVANNDGVWNGKEKSIFIKVLPPFWKTWWAFIIYLFVFSGLLYLFNSYSIKTERLKHQLELESVSHLMDQKLAQKKMTFFTNISHEIKTPLTLILAPIERLLEISAGNNSIQNQLSLMYRNGERLLKLINQLLDFRRFDSGNEKLIATKNDIITFSKEIFLAFKGLADRKHIALIFSTELSEQEVWFDKDKMEKILYNLLSNAIKFTPAGGSISVRIDKTILNLKDYLTIKVEDNGCGIAPEHIDKIFDQFKHYNENGLNEEGTGLGLTFSKELVELHKGKISVESKQATHEDSGCTIFTVQLPLGKAHLSDDEIDQSFSDEDNISQYYDSFASSKDKFRQRKLEILKGIEREKPLLLIVEDNPDVQAFIVSSFEDEFEISTASNGVEGLEKSLELLPDIIISDVMMPVMDGISLCNKLKTDIRTSHIPIILLTARSSTVFKIEGFETGADDYITKPFSINILNTRVWNLMDSRQKLRERYQREIRLEPQNIAITTADDKFLHDLMLFIEQNIDNAELTVDDLSREAAMARGTLYKKIKALTGQTVNDFIRTVRLKRAAQLLEQDRYNVNEIAFMVGFSDVNYFRKCFKEQFACTPKEYGKNIKYSDEVGEY